MTEQPDALNEYTALLTEGGRRAHPSWIIKSYEHTETRNGIAFTCQLEAAGEIVADVEQGGNGGATTLYWTQAADQDGTKGRFEAEAASIFPNDFEADGTLVEALLTRQGL
jgi:hypothetical protein